MTVWDVLDKMASSLPPIVALILVVAVVVIFIIGFSKYGMNFIKYGFKQVSLDETLENRLNEFTAKLATKEDISLLNTKIEAIETNHFGHLKDFLTELTSILLDKGVLNNQDKAHLDNQLRGM